MNIFIKTIEHEKQRYETTGDWYKDDDCTDDEGGGETIIVSVSNLNDWKKELLVGIHEAVEAQLCLNEGITAEMVDEFDFAFESARRKRFPTPDGFKFLFRDQFFDAGMEPGDCKLAPYWAQHQTATIIERKAADVLGVSWQEHNDAQEALCAEALHDAAGPTA